MLRDSNRRSPLMMLSFANRAVSSGDSFSDTIFGGAGDDFISGDWGGNLLSGGIGADTFYFGMGASSLDNSATQVDEISDFTSGEDLIQMFSLNWQNASGNFILSDADFVIGTEAGDASDRVMYDPTTGEIRMDFDGTGSMVAELFATVAPGTVLVASDFELLVF